MKVKLLIVCTFFIKLTFGQVWLIDFDSTGPLNSLFIDTIANKQNIWQIGVPDKPGFESAYSLPNVICTDLHKSYPVNDTSVFGIKTKIIKSDGSFEGMYISGRYKIDSDSLTDYGSIEFSADSGKLWYDLLADTNYLEAYCIQTNNEKTDFTGRKMKWHSFQFFLNSACFDIWFEKIILIKFSFISDSIQTNKAGWMIDDIEFDYIFESVEEVKSKPYLVVVNPNPANNQIRLTLPANNKSWLYQIINSTGQQLASGVLNQVENRINTAALPAGFYQLVLHEKSTGYTESQSLIITR